MSHEMLTLPITPHSKWLSQPSGKNRKSNPFLPELSRPDVEQSIVRLRTMKERSRLVARAAAYGMTNKEISEEFCIDEQTVKNVMTAIYDNLGFQDGRNMRSSLAYIVGIMEGGTNGDSGGRRSHHANSQGARQEEYS